MKTIRITPAFLCRAARCKAERPCSARVPRANTYAEVAYREWSDHYNIYSKAGQWLCSFTDSSLRGMPRFENLSTAQGIQVTFPTT